MTSTLGELWARSELEQLRQSSYRPQGWIRFLARALVRSRGTAAERPRLRRRSRRWGAAAVATAAFTPQALRRAGLPAPKPAAMVTWSAIEAVMLEWHLGMLEDEQGAGTELGAADALTLARAWLAPLALRSPAAPRLALAVLAVLATAALTDFFDGPLARRGRPSRLGVALDPVADASVLAALALGARREGLLSEFATGALLLRLGAPGALAAWRYLGRASPPPAAWARQTRPFTVPVTLGIGAALAGKAGSGSKLVGAGSIAALIQIARASQARSDPYLPAIARTDSTEAPVVVSNGSRDRA